MTMKCKSLTKILFSFFILDLTLAFQVAPRDVLPTRRQLLTCVAAENKTTKNDNKAMAFLRKRGKVGGSANQFTKSMGVDEGPVGKTSSGGVKVRLLFLLHFPVPNRISLLLTSFIL